ncbi:MAG: hypothetical protein KF774_15835 [Planctomyces sp.]|nr:hypothetical protein [Planctomyces sp.]
MPSWRDGRKPQTPRSTGGDPVPPPRGASGASRSEAAKPKGSWRGGGADAAAEPAQKWRRQEAKAAPGLTRAFWVRTGGLLTLALAAFLIYTVFQRPQATPVFALSILDYDQTPEELASSPWPPNAWVAEDFTHLAEVNTANLKFQPVAEHRFLAQDAGNQGLLKRLEDRLNSGRPGRPGRGKPEVLLIYLSAHTAENSRGEPCLITSDAHPLDDSTWLKFESVLATLRGTRPEIQKLVLFDCGRLHHDPTIGLTSNTFVERAAALVEEKHLEKPEALAVLFSHAPGQQSWGAPELGGSAFGFFVAEGLRGHANDNGDKWVSLDELHRFVRAQVSHWSRNRRGERGEQTPILAPAAAPKLDLAYAQSGALPEIVNRPTSNPDFRERMGRLQDAWKAFDEERGSIAAPDRTSATARGAIIRKLCQLELRNLAGGHYRITDPRQEIEALLRRLRVEPARPAIPPTSLPQHRWARQEPTDADLAAWTAATQAPLSPSALAPLLEPVAAPISTTELALARMIADGADPETPPDLVRAALRARQAAEDAACPAPPASSFLDLRFLPWTRDALTQLDRQRRACDDDLFANRWDGLEGRFDQLTRDYEAQRDLARDVARAYTISEEALAELIDNARWPLGLPQLPQKDIEARLEELNRSIERLQSLLQNPASDPAALSALVRDVERMREALRDDRGDIRSRLQRELREASVAVAEGSRMRNALAAVCLPSQALSHEDRRACRDYIYAYAYEAHGNVAKVSTVEFGTLAEAPTSSEISSAAEKLERLELAWLRRLQADQDDGEAGGAALRSQLRAFATRYNALTGVVTRESSAGNLETALRLAQVASVGRDLKPLQTDEARVVRMLQEGEAGAYLSWLVRRTVEDFWGPQEAPFFERIARRQLSAFNSLNAPAAPELAAEIDRAVEAASAGTARLAANDLAFNTDPKSPLDPAAAAALRLTLGVDPRTDDDGVVPAGRPAGTGALWVEGRRPASVIPLRSSRRLAFDVRASTPQEIVREELKDGALAQSGGGELIAFYRGHTVRRPLRITSVEEESVDWDYRPKPPEAARIRVEDPGGERPIVYFVIDCSASMTEKDIKGELGDDKVARWDVAVQELTSLLRSLSTDYPRQFDVGLIAFGHRYSFTTSSTGRRRLQNQPSPYATRLEARQLNQLATPNSFDGEDADAICAAADEAMFQLFNVDVEVLVEPRPLDARQFDDLRGMFGNAGLQPWGQTPLYGAIQKSVQQLKAPRLASRPRRIIVISDGMDYRPSMAGWGGEGIDFKTLQTQVREAGIAIDVVGIGGEFGDAKEGRGKPEANAAYKELEKIATCYFAANRQELLATLQRSLSPLSYHVSALDGTPLSQELALGQEWRIDPPQAPLDLLVQLMSGAEVLDQKPLRVEGGEQISLGVERTGQSAERSLRLRLPRYGFEGDADRDDPDGVRLNRNPVTTLAAPYRIFGGALPEPALDSCAVLVHQPKFDAAGAGRIFPISFQSGSDELFSPRPALVWIRATPRAGAREFTTRHTLYREFLPNRPVPVVPVEYPDWPGEAEECRLEIGFSYAPVAPDFSSRELSQGSIQVAGSDAEWSMRMGPRDPRGFVVVVTERHAALPADPVTALVTMSPAPEKIRRRVFSTSPRVDHEFYYASDALPADAELKILTRRTFEQRATILPGAAHVRAAVN